MNAFQAAILGLIQGFTEFLPVSSSAHLVLAPAYFGWEFGEAQAFVFDVLVQWGTLVAVIIFFWGDLLPIVRATLLSLRTRKLDDPHARLGWLIVLASIPAALIGLLVKDAIQAIFVNAGLAGWLLLVTAVLLIMAEVVGKRLREMETIQPLDALIIGAFQALALLPGISRSGATIAGAMSRNLKREAAARFSFLLSVPVMIGAGLLALLDLKDIPEAGTFVAPLLIGFLVAALVGYWSIKWLLKFLATRSLYPFAIYCIVLGGFSIWLFA